MLELGSEAFEELRAWWRRDLAAIMAGRGGEVPEAARPEWRARRDMERWTAADDARLLAEWAPGETVRLARELGRSVPSITARRAWLRGRGR